MLDKIFQYITTANIRVASEDKVIISNIINEAEKNFDEKDEQIAFISALIEDYVKIDETQVKLLLATA